VQINNVDHIPLTPSGKHRVVVNQAVHETPPPPREASTTCSLNRD
jgi:hypothetical protein